ncbi:hypothetical protein [Nonomuraea sp. NPDC052265]|uniref:hypothetical protein n=1 Tax=Nonomuraea sp. NPDC052265 TaxID=3364374 RepID=UPI0037C86F94
MSHTVALPALAGALFLMNVMLTLGVLRRLRAHTALIDGLYDLVAGVLNPSTATAPAPGTNDFPR